MITIATIITMNITTTITTTITITIRIATIMTISTIYTIITTVTIFAATSIITIKGPRPGAGNAGSIFSWVPSQNTQNDRIWPKPRFSGPEPGFGPDAKRDYI